jgi:hypothetical protein
MRKRQRSDTTKPRVRNLPKTKNRNILRVRPKPKPNPNPNVSLQVIDN